MIGRDPKLIVTAADDEPISASAAFSAAMSRCMSRPVASWVAQTPTEFSLVVWKVQSNAPVSES